jgi:hypothetical protein
MREEKVITISLWATKADAERYERDIDPKALNILKPFLTTPVNLNYYKLETAVCEHWSRRCLSKPCRNETPGANALGS